MSPIVVGDIPRSDLGSATGRGQDRCLLLGDLNGALDDAHQQLAHLGASEPARTTCTRPAVAPPLDDGRAETGGHQRGAFQGHQRTGSTTGSGAAADVLDISARPSGT